MTHDQARDDARRAVLATAHSYLERGWQPLPVPYKSKNPNRKGWQAERRTAADLDADFGRKLVNVGLLTGKPSGGLLDVDVDSVEALRLAATFLPETDAIFGREAKPASHWLYVTDEPGQTKQYKAPDGTMIVEYRATGSQTIAPPSVTSQPVRWDRPGEPRRIDGPILLTQVGRLAAAALLAYSWPKQGGRHDATLALAGGLLRSGWPEGDAVEFVVAVAAAARDEEALDRAADVRTTARRLADNVTATGWNTLRDIMGKQVVQRVHAWLGVVNGSASDGTSEGPTASNTPYAERDGKLYWIKPSREGITWVQLANFTARIVDDIVTDDGADRRRSWTMEARIGGRVATGTVPVERFAGLSWAIDLLGAGAVVSAGSTTRDHTRAAIQTLSGPMHEQQVYGHLGWRCIDGAWMYLHAGGAIGKDGVVEGVNVNPSTVLERFVLPDPVQGEALCEAIRASLAMLDVAPESVTAPLFAAPYRAPLGQMDGGVHLVGITGAGKSELAALAQQHYGAGLDRTHLPASWSSTANALEALAFVAKDCLLVVDDFAPGGSQHDIARYHRDADRLFRAQGNNAGRQRMSADATLRGSKHPRGLILSTGEDVVKGHSARARVLNVDVSREAVRFDRLTAYQRIAASGLPAIAMAGYLRWIAGRYDDLQTRVRDEVIELRERAHNSHAHRRTPELIANLAVGWKTWLAYALEVGAITGGEREALWARVWRGLGEAADQQDAQQRDADPTRRFLDLMAGAIASGAAHLADPRGEVPDQPSSWGWRDRGHANGPYTSSDWREQGSRVGWIDDDGMYLEPQAAFTAAQRVGTTTGEPLPCTQRMLSRMLFERRLLVHAERDRGRYTVRRDLEGRRRNVLHLKRDAIDAGSSDSTAQTAQTDQTDDSEPAHSWSDAPGGPFVGAVHTPPIDTTAQRNGPQADVHQENTESVGADGPFGPFTRQGASGFGERDVGWRCSGCRALESRAREDGSRTCAGCGAHTDDTGRVQCESCGAASEDGQRRRCLGCTQRTGDAA